MSSSYPRHVTGAGSAYYSYRPICKQIERSVRKTYRENASIPKDFVQYMNAAHPARSYVDVHDMRAARDLAGLSSGVESSRTSELASIDENSTRASAQGSYAVQQSSEKSAVEESARTMKYTTFVDTDNTGKRTLVNYSTNKQVTDEEEVYCPTTCMYKRLRGIHPYRLPVEDEIALPHPDSYWPVNRKHFDLVSSYDLMTDYLGITKANEDCRSKRNVRTIIQYI